MKRILPAASLAAVALAMAACGDTTTSAAEMDVTADSIQAALDEQAPTVRRVEVATIDERDAAAVSFIRPTGTQTDDGRVIVRGERLETNETLRRTGGLTGNMIAGVDPRVGDGSYGE